MSTPAVTFKETSTYQLNFFLLKDLPARCSFMHLPDVVLKGFDHKNTVTWIGVHTTRVEKANVSSEVMRAGGEPRMNNRTAEQQRTRTDIGRHIEEAFKELKLTYSPQTIDQGIRRVFDAVVSIRSASIHGATNTMGFAFIPLRRQVRIKLREDGPYQTEETALGGYSGTVTLFNRTIHFYVYHQCTNLAERVKIGDAAKETYAAIDREFSHIGCWTNGNDLKITDTHVRTAQRRTEEFVT